MKETNNILDKIDRRDGLTVPDGYFADFASRMMRDLPDRAEIERPATVVAPRSFWQRVRPYVYMAAMFAGVWCMLKMFMLMSGAGQELSIDKMPSLATAMQNEQFVEDYIIDDVSGFDLYDQMVADSIDFYSEGDSLFLPEVDLSVESGLHLPQ